jgi:hypothetical protein
LWRRRSPGSSQVLAERAREPASTTCLNSRRVGTAVLGAPRLPAAAVAALLQPRHARAQCGGVDELSEY